MAEPYIHENLIEVTSYKLKGELPDPFTFDDGTRMTSPEEWPRRRKEMFKSTIELQFGELVPDPEFLEVQPLYLGWHDGMNSYRIVTGRREKPVSFTMYVHKAKEKKEVAPAVITGDMCFQYPFAEDYRGAFVENGIDFVFFNRAELAPDISDYNIEVLPFESGEFKEGEKIWNALEKGECVGQLRDTYPDVKFSTIGAWAWGFSRCVDALEYLGFTDMKKIIFTGHSRGGKTAALAGALDERASFVCPSAPCAGGYSCYRLDIEAKTETGEIKESEDIANIFRFFPTWMGQGMREYIGKEEKLPFDSHFLKAMIAPRVLVVLDSASDIMANPVGSYQTTMAAKEVFKYLGCEDNLYWYFKRGTHSSTSYDMEQIVRVFKHVTEGAPLGDNFFKLPFKKVDPIWSWKRPDEE